jgi:anti-sigma regulatory factor (Ser/Thr protein kinase)
VSDSPTLGPEVADEILLTLPALATFARVARLAVTGLASRMGFSYDEIEDLRIAVGELTNVLIGDEASGGAEPGGRLELRCTFSADRLVVEATRTPPGTEPAITSLTDQILRAVVDDVEIDASEPRVRLLKRRRP